MKTGKREPYWDSLKFILIVLVVLGHTIPQNYKEGNNLSLSLFEWIYLFHMPLFIFISGRFSGIRDKERYFKGILRLAETLVVFQVIWLAISYINHSFYIGQLFAPYGILWFLLSLIIWRLSLYFLFDDIKNKPIILVLASVLISVGAGFVPLGMIIGFQRTMAFLPFFVAGYLCRNYDVKSQIKKVPLVLAMIVIVSGFVSISFIEDKSFIANITRCKSAYIDVGGAFLRLLYLITATCMSISVMRVAFVSERLAQYGTTTMIIYIYHYFITRLICKPLMVTGVIPDSLPFLLLYTFIIVLLLIITSHLQIITWLLNPISNIINRKE